MVDKTTDNMELLFLIKSYYNRNMLRIYFFLFVIIGFFLSCSKKYAEIESQVSSAHFYHESVKKLTDVIVYDIFSPPVASRIYAYPNIAAYEVLAAGSSEIQSLAGQLTGLETVPLPKSIISFPIAAHRAFLTVARALIFSEAKIQQYQDNYYQKMRAIGVNNKLFHRSVEYGESVAIHILDWAKKDKYDQTRTYSRYTFEERPETWKPTPPDYMEGIEPHWNKIRPFVIDSATQFIPPLPPPFSMEENSHFYADLWKVYEVGKTLDSEKEEIARFWDCNPYVSYHQGHAMFATKKITPGGHWIGITGITCRKRDLNLIRTVETYTRVSIALADAFISCWDEKWRSVLVRPETLINEHIDENWMPLLQTPPFPEYTSGHSVISTAAAVVLTDLFGKSFHFIDSTEVEYGLTARSFNSFLQASEEAAISRLYGGIHYMPAIENGILQGKYVGEFIVKNLQNRQKITNISLK